MNYKLFYILLAVVGCFVPYILAIEFMTENGFSWAILVDALSANGLAMGYVTDTLVATVAFWVVSIELYRNEDGPAPWAFIILTPFAGLGFTLPLYLFVRHVTRNAVASN